MKHLANKITNYVKRVLITAVGKDDKPISHCQVTYLSKIAAAECIYPYGMSAVAPVDNIGLAFTVCGNEANLAVMPYSQQDRFKNLKSGEVTFGSPVSGSYIKFLENGDIEITCKGKLIVSTVTDIDMTAQTFNVTAPAMNFTSGSFSFGFSTSGIFNGNGTFNFGTGGAAIARLGDEVVVDGKTGLITTGSIHNTSN